jgi:hypothetical protein
MSATTQLPFEQTHLLRLAPGVRELQAEGRARSERGLAELFD